MPMMYGSGTPWGTSVVRQSSPKPRTSSKTKPDKTHESAQSLRDRHRFPLQKETKQRFANMKKAFSTHKMAAIVAYYLIIAFLLFDPSSAAQAPRSYSNYVPSGSSWLRGQDDTSSGLTQNARSSGRFASSVGINSKSNLLGAKMGESRRFSRMAFLYRERLADARENRAGSVLVHVNDVHQREPITKYLNPLTQIFSIRGGASDTKLQSIVRSMLASPSLPSPIKQFIEMVCKFLESVTGIKILPNKNELKKSKGKRKSKAKVALVEEFSVGNKGSSGDAPTKTRRSKREKSVVHNDDEIEPDVVVEKKRKKKKTQSATPTKTGAASTIKTDKPSTAAAAATTTTQPKPRPDAASKKFLSNNLKSSNPNYRIQRELKEFLKSPPPGLSVKISGKNVRLWIITLSMPDNCVYAGETYKLRVQFPSDYPTTPPSVYFLPPTPRHEHVYTNGDICLSLLGKDWRPIMTAQMVAQAIMSILCGAQRKSMPMDNSRHAGNKPGQKQDDWVYHDDNC